MLRSLAKKRIASGAIVCASLVAAHTAHAAVDCATLPGTTYVTGSSAVKPFMAALGKVLSGTATIIYKGQGSCTGVDAILNGTKITGTASYWDAAGMEQTCNLTATGDVADIGVSDVFATSCAGVANVPADVGDFFGPNQVMEMVVPTGSSATSISAEAAYFVFGFGGMAGGVVPWTNDMNIFIRSATSGTQTMIGKAINVPSDKWKGVSEAKSSDVLNAVSMSLDPKSAIGILAADVADANRNVIKPLAYQHYKQNCGYWPDKTSSSFEKQNVRDGHYPIWGPLHMLAKVDMNKKPVKPDAANLIDLVQGNKTLPNTNILDVAASAHTIPDCAMKVKRSSEIGDVTPYTPAKECGCYYDFKANGSTTCAVCKIDGDCKGAANHCNFGYCEAH